MSTLSLADQGDTAPDRVGASEAVQLFVERAQTKRPGFTLTADNARHVAEICRKLAGLPLAIELAAALVVALTPAKIAARLGSGANLLKGRPQAEAPHHATLRHALMWSHELLAAKEQRLFRRLSGC